jgi:hypothetical protein
MTDQAKPDQSQLMNGQTYEDLCQRLIAAHPEDLINVISRVLEKRADVSHLRTEPEPDSPTTWMETAQFRVPGCPGKVDCTDEFHVDGHLAMADRIFTVAIRGTEAEYPYQAQERADKAQAEATVGYKCHLCGNIKRADEMTTLTVPQGAYHVCKVECRQPAQPTYEPLYTCHECRRNQFPLAQVTTRRYPGDQWWYVCDACTTNLDTPNIA